MVAFKLFAAVMLWGLAAASAGFTGACFEESKLSSDEGNSKQAVAYTAKSVGAALLALTLGTIGIMLVQR